MGKPGQHVVPSDRGWSVKRAGASRASGTFTTKAEAVKKAQEIAKKQKTELYIHGKNGRIQDRRSYGNDPVRSKG